MEGWAGWYRCNASREEIEAAGRGGGVGGCEGEKGGCAGIVWVDKRAEISWKWREGKGGDGRRSEQRGWLERSGWRDVGYGM